MYVHIHPPLHPQAKDIPARCSNLYDKCVVIIETTTSKTREQVLPFSRALSAMDELRGRSCKVLDVAELFTRVEEERGRLLMAVSGHGSGCGM